MFFLVQPGCVVVPPFLQVYVQLVESEVIASWHKLNSEQACEAVSFVSVCKTVVWCL